MSIRLKRRRSRQGFTLLELGLVLFILLLIAGIAMPMMSSLIAEERLRATTHELQLYARTARRLAMTENQPYAIKLAEKGFVLEPYGADKAQKEDILHARKLPSNAAYTVQRWGKKAFRKAADETWIFQPDGLCEPVRFHFQEGKNWIEFGFNPLTAAAQDETYFFQ